MGKIREKFKELRNKGKKAFIPYLTFGFPTLKDFEALLYVLDSAGSDFIEIGFPFSDPIADGPVIQTSSQVALDRGVNFLKLFSFLRRVKRNIKAPLILMSYYNPIYDMGLDNFFKKAHSFLEGVIIPDLLPEEGKDFLKKAKTYNVDTVFFISPTTQEERFSLIEKASSGFIYYISVTGVTGPRKSLPSDILSHLKKVRKKISSPVCLGFGISNRAQARKFKKYFDGIIVGSALVKKIIETHHKKNFLKEFKEFILWLNS